MNINCKTKLAGSHVSESEIQSILQNRKELIKAVQAGLEQDKASLGWFSVDQTCSSKLHDIAQKVQNTAEVMIVIGIGGSNRAAIAALDALRRDANSPTTLYFAGDSLSGARLQDALYLVRTKSVVLNVIAKDFNTIEPGVWFRLLRAAMQKKYGSKYNERIVAIGSKGEGQLYNLAMLHGYAFLPFPKDVGGRFSALSPVGLFPLAVAGLDVENILEGARTMEQQIKSTPIEDNSAVRYAVLRNIIRKKQIQVESLVFFEPDLFAFSRWWIQLFAESEGKTDSVLLPVGFSYSEDLHAVGQYVQDGPRIILETFLNVSYQTEELPIEPSKYIEDGFSYLDRKPFSTLNESVYRSALMAHSEDGVPCCELTINSFIDEQTVGSMFWFFLFSAYLSSTLLGVNPFDQDGVENYKKNMYAELGKREPDNDYYVHREYDMAVKLKDIALDVGVSISTVSRILNNDSSRKSNEKTVAKVFEAAERLGYFAQKLAPARYMEYKNTDTTFSVACILTSEHETYVSPFFSDLLAGIQQEVISQGSAFPHNFFVTYIKDPGFLNFIQNTKLDCAIVLGRTSLENINMLKSTIPNLVYAGVNEIGHEIDEVLCDSHLAVMEAMEYLIGLGHRDIGFIGPTQVKHQVFNEHRFQGYLDAMAKHALPVSEKLVVDTILTANDGYESMKHLIRNGTLPSALFCGNDTVAMGVMKALDEAGVLVPHDISLVGFDNIDTSIYLKPTLTTIDIPKKELGRLAVKVLLDRLTSNRQYSIRVTIPYSLLIRDSCRAFTR